VDSLNELLARPPFSLPQREKARRLAERLAQLTAFHCQACPPYRRMVEAQGKEAVAPQSSEQIPFIPASLFKHMDLLSVPPEQIVKTLTSSGTQGQRVSTIYLDRETAIAQQRSLVNIVSDFIGRARLPLLIIDSPDVLTNRRLFSARGAGILGFSLFGRDRTFALTPQMMPDWQAIDAFLRRHHGRPVLLFGFTFILWRHFYQPLLQRKQRVDLSCATLIHGGGWKKLSEAAVSAEAFSDALRQLCGLSRIHDYYGMVEQTGSLYLQCASGHLHASLCSDIIMRRHQDFSPCETGEPGLIQVVSALPRSYPGHSLLTEDRGVILGSDDCPCGRKGNYFRVLGRVKDAEIRGCSDTYAAAF